MTLPYTFSCIRISDINECASEPCENGGTCIDEVDGFECDCTAAFGGTFCETRKLPSSAKILFNHKCYQHALTTTPDPFV